MYRESSSRQTRQTLHVNKKQPSDKRDCLSGVCYRVSDPSMIFAAACNPALDQVRRFQLFLVLCINEAEADLRTTQSRFTVVFKPVAFGFVFFVVVTVAN
ncbi:uncharacterized protein M421DRAFT_419105 [Didymella exigua CBS 183.55]|uniref:Uncharacterized protein n=1 Tax=Didymella exigua CBS 183.55 TaxID=1150837 RepID=A0A6A5RNW1_9PLEO|nr:uncharacterized protein M421DRAFT_419105 [Didymella exigua CBS 183.55]KAF1930075.1 hypothetical protein M421DRAFT_419105 [Didymella exigua CBS 183.55]